MRVNIDYVAVKKTADLISKHAGADGIAKSVNKVVQETTKISEAWEDATHKEHVHVIETRKTELEKMIKELKNMAGVLYSANSLYKSAIEKNIKIAKNLLS